MSYPCPRCEAPTTSNPTYMGGGLIGLLLMYAIAGRKCQSCGPIDRKEFSEETRSTMFWRTVVAVIGVVVLFVVIVGTAVVLLLGDFD